MPMLQVFEIVSAGMVTFYLAWVIPDRGDAPTMKPQKLPPIDSVDDTAVRALVAHIDVLVAQKTPLSVALHAMGFCAAILLRELLEAGVDAKPSFLRGLECAGTITRTLMN
jgi:hypothetical protein